MNWDFVEKNTSTSSATATDIGYGLRPEHALEQAAANPSHDGKHGALEDITFEEYEDAVAPYTVEYVSELSGVPAAKLEALAKLYADPNSKVMSLLDDGLQPAHPRRLGEQR